MLEELENIDFESMGFRRLRKKSKMVSKPTRAWRSWKYGKRKMLAVNEQRRKLQEEGAFEEWSREPDVSRSIEERLNVYIEDFSDYEPDVKAQIQKFRWSLAEAS